MFFGWRLDRIAALVVLITTISTNVSVTLLTLYQVGIKAESPAGFDIINMMGALCVQYLFHPFDECVTSARQLKAFLFGKLFNV